jgi:hypothetical protein
MSREFQVSRDGETWYSVGAETFATLVWPHSRWRDASDWEVVEEPANGGCDHRAKSDFACAMSQPDGATGGRCCDCECHKTTARETARLEREKQELHRDWRDESRRLEQELAEARKAKHAGRDVLIAAACWKAQKAGGPFPFEVKCSVIDYMRAGIKGDRLVIHMPGTDWLHVFLVPVPDLPEGELA